jgi:AAA+ ATPase superfamily predicted ATPase
MFIGREEEIALLRRKENDDRAPLIAVYGRRRVGKTALVEKAFEKEMIWKFEGLEGAGMREQIKHFMFTLRQYSRHESLGKHTKLTRWEEAFIILGECIGEKPVVVFFDEFQWMASMRGQLVSVFKWAWDNYFSKKKGCRFVICGSVSSFIVKKVLRSSALYGRIHLEVQLKPLSMKECAGLYDGRRPAGEVLDIYISLGGIPQYLLELRQNESPVQNLVRLALSPHGYFFNEYQRLFVSHFSKNKAYEHILKSLALKRVQDSAALEHASGLSSGGTFSSLLDDLEMAGFIERFSPLEKERNSKLVRIRLIDEFLDFYFTFVEKNRKEIEQGTLKAYELLTGPKFEQWRGYAFERFCRKHAKAIAQALGFSGIRYRSGSWFKSMGKETIQADLVFDRVDGVITLCEAKYVGKMKSEAGSNILRQAEALGDYFRRPVQKVLMLAYSIPLPASVKNGFDTVLYADEVFFQG